MEQSILGACLVYQSRALEAASAVLRGDPERIFYQRAHAHIWRAICDLEDDGHPVDQLTVSESLAQRGQLEAAGGVTYLAELAGCVASAAQVRHHATIVLEKARWRQMIELAAEIQSAGYEATQNVDDVVGRFSQQLYDLSNAAATGGGYRPLEMFISEALEVYDEAAKNPGGLTGVPAGLTDLDDYTSGWQKGDFILLAARPSTGKSALSFGMGRHAALNANVPVGIVSLEMSGLQISQRLLSIGSGVDLQAIRRGEAGPDGALAIAQAASRDARAPIYIDDQAGQTIVDIRSRARNLVQQRGVRMLIVDYLQLVDPTEASDSSEREISQISKGLKRIARELNIPVVALSQLSRAPMSRKGHTPQLSDLRGSGSLEQDADVVIFIHRPAQFGIEFDDDGNDLRNMAELHIAKQRNGPTGLVEVSWDKKTTLFRDLERHAIEPPAPWN